MENKIALISPVGINDPYLEQQGKNKTHDPRYFAMLNIAPSIGGTNYEGGNSTDALAYYQYLLNLELPDCPISFKLSEVQQQAIKSGIDALLTSSRFLDQSFADKTINSQEWLEKFIIDIRAKKKQLLSTIRLDGKEGWTFCRIKT